MKEQLLLLLELQKIDIRAQEARAAIASIPEKLAPAKEDLQKLEQMLQAEQLQIADTESWHKEQSQLIQNDEEELKNAKTKVQSAKTPREYAAASREVDNKRRSIREREDEILKVSEVLDKSRSDVSEHEKNVQELRTHIQTEEERIRESLGGIVQEAEEIENSRESVVIKVEKRLLNRYEQGRKKRGYAIAPVENGTCLGCHMQVPPQLNNILARLESIETCPRCHRLLYRKEIFDDPQNEPEKE